MMNPMQFIQMIRGGQNPQQLVINMLQQQSAANPVMANLLQYAQAGDKNGIEQIARNICKEKGMDFDTAFNNFKQTLGL